MNLPKIRLALRSLMTGVHSYVFPEYSEPCADIGSLLSELLDEVGAPKETGARFREALPGIRALIQSDVDAIINNDPAVAGRDEVVACYPAVAALLHYRTAHVLHGLGVPVLPRMLTEYAHSTTGIDIHPAATIGDHFAIDHGTGVVIGATAVIGSHVTFYQGVTLGARNFRQGPDGRPMDIPRHPIVQDGVTVYSNASLLGRITIGEGAVIGGNVWLTHSVPAGARVLQGKTQDFFADGAGI
ncbi:MAG: serine acetyltransferase [Bacteroidales bacterium]|nr:serine acetyltransferase [Bacteroidales bacterium]